jgi:hypothetical protein
VAGAIWPTKLATVTKREHTGGNQAQGSQEEKDKICTFGG